MKMMKTFCIGFLLVLVGSMVLYAKSYGTWETGTDGKDIVYASTTNDSKHEFGQACDTKDATCFWFIGLTTKCKEGTKYPVLANAEDQAVTLELLCYGPSSLNDYTYTFTDFDRVDRIVRESKQVGIAIPMQSGEFIVVRFDLRSAKDALKEMRDVAVKRSKGGALRNTLDKKL